MYRIVVRGCAGLAAAIAAVYITALSLAVQDGPAGIEVSYRVNSVAIASFSICVVLSGGGWITRAIVRDELAAGRAAATTAAVVVAANREFMGGELLEQVEAWLGRAQTRGMAMNVEAKNRANGGSVASIGSRRDT